MAHMQSNFHMRPENVPAPATKHNGMSAGTSSSSALRPSQLPPILKKVGSLSSNVAKHTARFVSPHESAEEDGIESDIPSSGSTLASGFDISGQAVVNTQANTRASSVSQGLQPSTGTTELVSKLSTAGKQPVRNEASSLSARQMRNAGQPDADTKDTGRQQTNTTTPNAESLAQNDRKVSSKLSAREKVVLGKQPMMRRTQSSTVPDRPRELSMAKPKRSLFTEATSSTTNVAAQGTIIDQAGSIRDLPHLSTSNLTRDDETSPHGGSSASSLLEGRLTPTRPTSSAVLPLGRTKSQLTLLLEREKERSRS